VGPLVSDFPEDLYNFVSQRLDLLANNLSGEVFMEIILVLTTFLNKFQERERNRVLTNMMSKDRIKIILFINNYSNCIKLTSEAKKDVVEMANEDLVLRIENLFDQISMGYMESIDILLRSLVKYLFEEIRSEYIPFLFC